MLCGALSLCFSLSLSVCLSLPPLSLPLSLCLSLSLYSPACVCVCVSVCACVRAGMILGQGAFGRVMKAEAIGIGDSQDVTTVAVKMVKGK